MNLTTDPWIPVVLQNGKTELICLQEAFARGKEIADLSVRPHERIALMRLLICVAQAALDGPKDEEDWQGCNERIIPAVSDYLEKWKSVFELFGDGPRFLQVTGKGFLTPIELDKLDFIDAGMTTLFDQHIVPGREHKPAHIALCLVTYQSFAAGGTVGGSEIIKGKKQVQKGKNGPCRDSSALHTFIRKEDLHASLYYNLITRKRIASLGNMAWGVPVWELKATTLADLETSGSISRSYLGRLAPMSRAVWLNTDCKTALHANGINYPNFSEDQVRETTVSIRRVRDSKGTEKRSLLAASEGKDIRQPWRELYALVVKRLNAQGVGGALALQNLDDATPFDLWVGAVVTDKAKIRDTVESVFNLPAEFLNQSVQDAYESGVHYADKWAHRVKYALIIFRLAMETNAKSFKGLSQKSAKLNQSDRKRLGRIGDKALAFYWTQIEQGLPKLQEFAIGPLPMKDGLIRFQDATWGKHVYRSALDAYTCACPHETPRQIQAYALGLKVLTEFQYVNNQEVNKEVAHDET